MKNSKIIISLLFVLSLISCGTKDTKPIKVNLIAKGKLAETSTELMPAHILAFIRPIEACDKAFIPEVTISRTDLQNEPPFKIEVPKETANSIRNWFGTYDYSNLNDDYTEYLPKLTAGEYLSKVGTNSDVDTFKYGANDAVFYLRSNSNPDSIVKLITQNLNSKKINGSQKIVIVLNGNSGSNGEGTVQDADNEKITASIKSETETANKIKDANDRVTALDEVNKKYSTKTSLDYWAYYELAKNRIEGSKHEEAFAFLKRATELAIAKKEGEILLGRINDDTEKDLKISDPYKRGAWRLTTGHLEQWSAIKEALEHNDIEELSHMAATHEHHEH